MDAMKRLIKMEKVREEVSNCDQRGIRVTGWAFSQSGWR